MDVHNRKNKYVSEVTCFFRLHSCMKKTSWKKVCLFKYLNYVIDCHQSQCFKSPDRCRKTELLTHIPSESVSVFVWQCLCVFESVHECVCMWMGVAMPGKRTSRQTDRERASALTGPV